MYISLYRKYRPDSFKGVIGQDHIIKTLINQIKSQMVSHAYLFTGTRGTGKTSTAKIFAKAVNCLTPVEGSPCGKCQNCIALSNPSNLDIIEMDAASNNGVEEIRELKENVQYPPSNGKYKVYIIDEVHMLTTSAFNALLKTLEEPPAHALFILATTEVHKIPQTILSRCMRFDFRLVARDTIIAYLRDILNKENVGYDLSALSILALHGEGSVRDTLSITDMCLSYSPEYLSHDSVLEVLGTSDFETLFNLTKAILEADVSAALTLSAQIAAKGKSVTLLTKELSSFLNEAIAIKNITSYTSDFDLADHKRLFNLMENHQNYRIMRAIEIFTLAEGQLKYSSFPKIIFDAACVKAAEICTEQSNEALILRISELEKKLNQALKGGIAIEEKSPKNAIESLPILEVKEDIKPAENKEKSQENNKKQADLESLLLSFATKAEDGAVFNASKSDDVNGDDMDTLGAANIFGSVLLRLREEGENFIYYALKGLDDFSLKDNEFMLYVDSVAIQNTLNNPTNQTILNRILAGIMGEGYTFKTVSRAQKKLDENKDKMELIDLFGDKFVDKTKK